MSMVNGYTTCAVASTFAIIIVSFVTISQFYQFRFTEDLPESSNISTLLRQPEQVHIALGAEKNSMVVSWMTTDEAQSSAFVGITPNSINTEYKGNCKRFHGRESRSQFIHSVTISNLNPNIFYFYYVGSEEGGWSDIFWFHTFPDDNFSPSFAYFGDFGFTNAVSLPQLQQETHNGQYDLFIHAGDIAYNLEDDDGQVGDSFMRQIEPISAYVPYMTIPGNHEHADDYLEYRNRFLMPVDEPTLSKSELYYSFDVGTVHFIGLNVEVYYKNGGTVKNVSSQYQWLINDLETANKPENRKQRPWIIMYGHRGMYCSPGWWDCAKPNAKPRVGIKIGGGLKYGLEDLLMQYNVDLCMWAHKHNYERLWPVYNYTTYKPSSNSSAEKYAIEFVNIITSDDPYTDPRAPVHITTGSAGSKEGLAWWSKNTGKDPPFLAAKSFDYGYTRIKVHNSSHLHLQQVSIDKGGNVIDEIWIKNFDHDFNKRSESMKT